VATSVLADVTVSAEELRRISANRQLMTVYTVHHNVVYVEVLQHRHVTYGINYVCLFKTVLKCFLNDNFSVPGNVIIIALIVTLVCIFNSCS